MVETYKPRTDVVEAFQYFWGVKHRVLREQEYSEPEGGPPLGGGVEVLVGSEGQTRTVNPGEYVIVLSDGICRVVASEIFEALYEPWRTT
jgi:hypothetical protein